MSEEVTPEMIEAAHDQFLPSRVPLNDLQLKAVYLGMRSADPEWIGTEEMEQALLNDIAVMMSEFVDNWPQPKRLYTALKLIAKTLRAALANQEQSA